MANTMINIIAAMTKERVIGKDNKLPWHIPEDLANFKKLTSGHTVVLGRKTYESIPKRFRPLSNRNNIVVSRTMPTEAGIDVCPSLEEAIATAQAYGKEIFIVGGASIYQQALPITDRMYISQIKKNYPGDAYFPNFDVNEWEIEQQEDYPAWELVVYARKKLKNSFKLEE